jgi:hypothetical protein
MKLVMSDAASRDQFCLAYSIRHVAQRTDAAMAI